MHWAHVQNWLTRHSWLSFVFVVVFFFAFEWYDSEIEISLFRCVILCLRTYKLIIKMYTVCRIHLIYFSLSSFSTFVPIFSLLLYWFNRFDYNKRKVITFKDNKQMDRSRMKKNKKSSRHRVALANGYDETTISTDINRTQVTGAHKHIEAHIQRDTNTKKASQTVFFVRILSFWIDIFEIPICFLFSFFFSFVLKHMFYRSCAVHEKLCVPRFVYRCSAPVEN